jgi:hypothetical protein
MPTKVGIKWLLIIIILIIIFYHNNFSIVINVIIIITLTTIKCNIKIIIDYTFVNYNWK